LFQFINLDGMIMQIIDKKSAEFTEIYSDNYPLIFGKIYSKLGNIDDTEDLCHDVFTLLYKKYSDVRNPRAWLVGAMNFMILEYYKKREKRNHTVVDADSFEERSEFDPDKYDTSLIIKEALEDTNNYKDDRDKIIFELIAIYDYTYKEVAKHLGIQTHKVRYSYTTSVRRIEEHLKMKMGIRNLDELL
jgi:RNA polymerase sigma factor (sigma-70 family)